MPNWKKVIVSGSDASLNSLNVTAGVTGSLLGTSSFASTASFINPLNQNALITGSLTVSSSNATQFLVGSNLVFVSSSGNVGIGTTSPTHLLDVNGLARVQKDGAGGYAFTAQKNISGSTGTYNSTTANTLTVTSTGTTGYQSAALSNNLVVNQNAGLNYLFGHEWSAMTNNLSIQSYGSVAAGADRVANTVISTTIGYNRSITDTLYDLYFLYYNYGSVATHWGIYHSATDAKHYFQGKLMTGTGADLGYQFRVSGSSGFTGNMGITGSASNSLRVKGSGATSATNALLIENSSGTALLTVNDAGNITGSFTGSFLGTASYATQALTASNANTASYVLNAVSASFASTASYVATSQTASYILQAVSASFASTASFVNTLNQNVTITGSLLVSGSSVVTGSFTVFTGSAIEFQVLPTGVKIGNIITDVHTVTGSLNVSGSINTIAAITASTALISGSGVSRLTVIGSGSSSPIFTVQGSQGELFSITDSLSGSLFSVNDISGLPILEVFSDNTTLIGDYQAPALHTTKKISGSSGINLIYSLNTGSYDGVFMDYTAKSGSNARAGNFAAIWSGSSVNYMDNSTTDFGNTSGLVFGASISGSNMIVTGSASTSGWTIKAIIRSI